MAAVEPLIIQQLYHMASLKGLVFKETESLAAKPEFLYPITKTKTETFRFTLECEHFVLEDQNQTLHGIYPNIIKVSDLYRDSLVVLLQIKNPNYSKACISYFNLNNEKPTTCYMY